MGRVGDAEQGHHRLFSCGNLTQVEVQRAVFGRELDMRLDAVLGYELAVLQVSDLDVIGLGGRDRHPILRRSDSSGAAVGGMTFALTDEELAAADKYEVADYVRVLAPLRSGGRAWVYVKRHPSSELWWTGSADLHLIPHLDRSALVIIDVQVDFVDGGATPIPGTSAVLPQIARLRQAYRVAGQPIVHMVRLYRGQDVDRSRRTLVDSGASVVSPGSAGSQIAPELRSAQVGLLKGDLLLGGGIQQFTANEVAIFKPRWSAFHRTPLHQHLQDLHVDTVVFAGCNFPNCPRASLYDASEHDYRVLIVHDAISRLADYHLAEAQLIGAVHTDTATVAHHLRIGQLS